MNSGLRRFGATSVTRANVRQRAMHALFATALLFGGAMAFAQVPVNDEGVPLTTDITPVAGADVENLAVGPSTVLSAAELDELVGPIALYPDDLLAVVLPASTYPLEIVQAARFLDRYEVDPTLEPNAEWDDSVIALLNYPEVLRMMNDDLDWTWRLGDAVVRQQPEVILAVESFRDRAYAAGNLQSDQYQTVSVDDDGIIEIDPISDDEIYVPYYEPSRVVYASPTPVYHYYPRAYPVYFYPYPRSHYLSSGFFWGVTTAFSIGWATDHLHVYHHSYRGHPFYGRRYHFTGSYWRRPSINIYNTWYVDNRHPNYRNRHFRGDYWRPRYRSGARPTNRTIQSGYNRSTYRDRDYDRNRRANSYEYRDQRTDGRRYNAGVSRTQPQRTDARQRTTNRDEIRFRPRNGGTVTAGRSQRLENNAVRNSTSRRSDASNRSSASRQNVARTDRSARTSTNRQSVASANRSRTTSLQSRSNRSSDARRAERRSSSAPQTNRRTSTASTQRSQVNRSNNSARTSTNRQSAAPVSRSRTTALQSRSNRSSDARRTERRSSSAPQTSRRTVAANTQRSQASRSNSSARTQVARRPEPTRRASPAPRRSTSSATTSRRPATAQRSSAPRVKARSSSSRSSAAPRRSSSRGSDRRRTND